MNKRDREEVFIVATKTFIVGIFVLVFLVNFIGWTFSFEKEKTFYEFSCHGDCSVGRICDMNLPDKQEKFVSYYGCLNRNNDLVPIEDSLKDKGECKLIKNEDSTYGFYCKQTTNSWNFYPTFVKKEGMK